MGRSKKKLAKQGKMAAKIAKAAETQRSKKVEASMKPQMDAQATASEPLSTEPGFVEGWMSARAKERMVVQTFPCGACGEELDHTNRSILQDGSVLHIGCKTPKKAAKGAAKPKPVLAGLAKHAGAEVPERPPEPPNGPAAFCDYQGRTCVQVARDLATVTFVPFDLAGLHLTYAPRSTFDARYKPLEGYPVKKAFDTYKKFARDYGATQDVLDALGREVKLTQEDVDMAKKKMAARASGSNGHSNGAKNGARTPGAKRETASAMFQQLIMEGKLNDDQIFSKVKSKFGLDDKKRSYVAWYRNHLKKGGKKPPAAKEAKS